jgi:V/A-type H+-transporting ATPase subunit E
MAGIDKITGEILKEAQQRADEILSQAQEAAKEARNMAEKEIRQIREASGEQSDKEVKNYASRIQSAVDIDRKKAMLSAKQEIISAAIEKAYRKLDSQDDDSYFEMILGILAKSVRPEEGMIIFSARDLKRMPEGFSEKASAAAEKKGGSLKISDRPGKIDNGFVLSYGGIEENCSLRAIFDSKKDEMQDKAFRILFS